MKEYDLEIAKQHFKRAWEERGKNDLDETVDAIRQAVEKGDKSLWIGKYLSTPTKDELVRRGFKLHECLDRNEPATKITGWCEDGL